MIFNQFCMPHSCTQLYSLNQYAESFIPRVSVNSVLKTDELNGNQIWNNLTVITSILNVKAKVFKPILCNYTNTEYIPSDLIGNKLLPNINDISQIDVIDKMRRLTMITVVKVKFPIFY